MPAGLDKGYRHHPQLARFYSQANTQGAIAVYLREVQHEATRRGYRFDASKIGQCAECLHIAVTSGQMNYELAHLRTKLAVRDAAAWQRIAEVKNPEPHPLFVVVKGEVEDREVW